MGEIGAGKLYSSAEIYILANSGNVCSPPADRDITMDIQTIQLFFNTTLSHSGGDTTFNKACEKAGGYGDKDTICVVEKTGRNTTSSAVHLQSWGWHSGITWAVLTLIISFALVF